MLEYCAIVKNHGQVSPWFLLSARKQAVLNPLAQTEDLFLNCFDH
jgi:hypothetical protein